MKYILTEEEYNNLKEAPGKVKDKYATIINKLCQKICDNEPVLDWRAEVGDKVGTPWGCIYSSEDEWYCDECTVSDICTRSKNWSK